MSDSSTAETEAATKAETESGNWMQVTPSAAHRERNPTVAVMPRGRLYLNKLADLRWFDGVDHVYLHVDPEEQLLGLEPATTEAAETYTIQRDDDYGGEISAVSALRLLGVPLDNVEEGHRFEATELENGFVAVDVSELFDQVGGDHPESDDASLETEAAAQTDAGAHADGPDDADKQDVVEAPIEAIEDDSRRQLARAIDAMLDTTRIVEATSSELSEQLAVDINSRSLAQNLRVLRDDDHDYPYDIQYVEGGQGTDSFWRLRPTGDRDYDDDGQTHQYNVDDEGDAPGAVVEAAIEDGHDDIHEIAVETGLSTTEVRAAAREIGEYGPLHDAAEGGGYGRGDVE
jgi:AraC-like DNA-binding protein